MKIFLLLAAVVIACFTASCQTTDDVPTPASSGVWRLSPGAP
ncbi:MAG: hypothetical protein ACR2RV_06390 [Verrucomicrobiales bacterium]